MAADILWGSRCDERSSRRCDCSTTTPQVTKRLRESSPFPVCLSQINSVFMTNIGSSVLTPRRRQINIVHLIDC